MKKFESPMLDIIWFEDLDVIATSAPPVAGDYQNDLDKIDFDVFS